MNVTIKNGYKIGLVLLLVIAGYSQPFFAAAQTAATPSEEFTELMKMFMADKTVRAPFFQNKKRLRRMQEIIVNNPEVARLHFLEGWGNDLNFAAKYIKDRGVMLNKMVIEYGEDIISICNSISESIQKLELTEVAAAEEGTASGAEVGISEPIASEVNPSLAIGVRPIIGAYLYIPRNMLFDKQGELVNIKELFERYHIDYATRFHKEHLDKKSVQDQNQYWLNLANTFKSRLDTREPRQWYEVTPADVPLLVAAAHNTLKSLLLDDQKLSFYEENYIKKSGLARLLAYASIKQDIERKPLPHVHVPKKLLVIQRHESGEYVSSKDAPAIIDDIVKAVFSVTNHGVQVTIGTDSTTHDYDFTIFAERIERHPRRSLSKEAFTELQELCKDCPFDVGYPSGQGVNIFTDANGDAWIIDTEFKGEPPSLCIKKLDRYR